MKNSPDMPLKWTTSIPTSRARSENSGPAASSPAASGVAGAVRGTPARPVSAGGVDGTGRSQAQIGASPTTNAIADRRRTVTPRLA
jgi:hypothetical protein